MIFEGPEALRAPIFRSEIGPKTLCFALGARFRARSTPSKSALASLRGRKNNFGCARGRPKEISQLFFAPLKTDTPGGGGTVFRTSILAPFS